MKSIIALEAVKSGLIMQKALYGNADKALEHIEQELEQARKELPDYSIKLSPKIEGLDGESE